MSGKILKEYNLKKKRKYLISPNILGKEVTFINNILNCIPVVANGKHLLWPNGNMCGTSILYKQCNMEYFPL